MTDQWDQWAREHLRRQTQQRQAEDAARAAELAKWQSEQTAHDSFMAELNTLVQAVAPELAKFLAKHGQSAQNLLAATGTDTAHILFGSDNHGSHYSSVYFGPKGLSYETGHGSSYSMQVSPWASATAGQAVEYFARYGDGYDHTNKRIDHNKVRGIVEWFIEQMNRFKPRT